MRIFNFLLHINVTLLATIATLLVTPAFAHEYYLEPSSYTVKIGEEFGVAHKNGMRFNGNAYPWISQWNVRSEAWQNGSGVKVRGKDGDAPALKLKSNQTGLISIIHESGLSSLKFNSWDKFKSYLADEGLSHLLVQHKAAGYPEIFIKEVYTRYAKTLVNVGGGDGLESPAGLKIELIALANPATLKRGEPLPVKVVFNSKPLANVTIKVFAGHKTDPAHKIITDEKGHALIPDSGPGDYLLNAVHMTKPVSKEPMAKDAHWESFWASMTLQRP